MRNPSGGEPTFAELITCLPPCPAIHLGSLGCPWELQGLPTCGGNACDELCADVARCQPIEETTYEPYVFRIRCTCMLNLNPSQNRFTRLTQMKTQAGGVKLWSDMAGGVEMKTELSELLSVFRTVNFFVFPAHASLPTHPHTVCHPGICVLTSLACLSPVHSQEPPHSWKPGQ
jgi:hypothetical protein